MFFYDEQNGKRWFKGNLHTHTTASDGKYTPEEVLRMYKDRGYDFLAITDHWVYREGENFEGMCVLSGAEYNIYKGDKFCPRKPHIVCIGTEREPDIEDTKWQNEQIIIDKINEAGGIAIWGHPAWSMSSPEEMAQTSGYVGVEIYNHACATDEWSRGYSGVHVDCTYSRKRDFFVTACDDLHAGTIGGYICVKAKSNSREDILSAIRKGEFYASSGPEIINISLRGNRIYVECSPAEKAAFLSSSVWTPGRVKYGRGETEFSYEIQPYEEYVRVEITDKNGNTAYSQPIFLKEAKNV